MVRAFVWVYTGSALVYRLILAGAVSASEAPPLGAAKGITTGTAILLSLSHDLLLMLVALGACTLVTWRQIRRDSGSSGPGLFIIVLPLLLFWQVIAMGSHINLLFTMNTGFTWSTFMEFFTILSFRDFITLLHARDYVALALPLIAYVVAHHYLLAPARPGYILGISGAVIMGLMATKAFATAVPDELVLNPSVYLIRDVVRNFSMARPEMIIKPGNNLYLGDDLFATTANSPEAVAGADASKMNIIFIVLESTASEYIFDTKRYAGGKMPMPFLYELSKKSLYAGMHFASNNSSPRSLFSIFSGLYESPETSFFSMQKKLKIPHLLDHLGGKASREAFLVTPADLDWYFPKSWFRNRGFTRLIDYHSLKKIPEYRAGPTSVRDEFKTVKHFLGLVDKARKPFLGVYYSFIGHWPYPDLPDERIIPPDTMRNRYINNLYAQDKIIARIVRHLEKSGKLTESVLVIVGDHGEAFFQHPGNRVHSGESYNENLVSPLMIYAPGRISPQRIEFPTVHADIVPTLMTALELRFDPKRFQGESILRGKMRRRYVFSYGNENTLTAVSAELKKMQILQAKNTCRYFDLATDWRERNNMPCESTSDHYRALNEFYRLQPSLLRSYNELCATTGCR